MSPTEYQKEAHEFADYPIAIMKSNGNELPYYYPVAGLSEECGEFCGKMAKSFRDNNGYISPELTQLLAKELGDIMWFVAENATLLGLDLELIMAGNIAKLKDRKLRNKIHGSGDER